MPIFRRLNILVTRNAETTGQLPGIYSHFKLIFNSSGICSTAIGNRANTFYQQSRKQILKSGKGWCINQLKGLVRNCVVLALYRGMLWYCDLCFLLVVFAFRMPSLISHNKIEDLSLLSPFKKNYFPHLWFCFLYVFELFDLLRYARKMSLKWHLILTLLNNFKTGTMI